MLVVEDLRVEVGGREILKGVDLVIGDGERHVLFGPNGSGKSTLLMTIMGFPNYRVKSGRIEFNGVDITDMPVNERAKLGIALAYQHPPSIRGVRLEDMIKICSGKEEIGEKERELLEKLKISPDFLKRDVNFGFSGGEVKRSEILQLLLMKPKLAMMDEPDSGVDVENIEVVGNAINELLKGRSGLIITHLGYILKYVEVDFGHVMMNGRIACSGDPHKLLSSIISEGYSRCASCVK